MRKKKEYLKINFKYSKAKNNKLIRNINVNKILKLLI